MSEEPFTHSILVGSDLSTSSDRIIREAAAIARWGGAELHVVSAYAVPSSALGGDLAALPPEVVNEVERALPTQLRRIMTQEWPASSEVRFGPAATVILERAREVHAGLIVLGPHRGRDVRAHFLGTTADEVLRRSEIPCLALRGALPLPLCRIGVATDFSDTGGRAIVTALRWAAWLGTHDRSDSPTRLCAVHVLAPDEGSRIEECRSELAGAVEAARAQGPADLQVELRSEVFSSHGVAAALQGWAMRAELDLLVVGTHGKGVPQRWTLGSTSSTLARTAPCPILLVPRAGTAE